MTTKPSRRDVAEGIAWRIRHEGVDARVVARGEMPTARPVSTDQTERYVEVEWVGEPSIFDDPRVKYALLMEGKPGGFTPHQAAVIRATNKVRIARFKGHTREKGRVDGLSQEYAWGHRVKSYIRRMPFRDADKLLSMADGYEFRIVGTERHQSPLERNLLPLLPQAHFRLVGEREFSRIEAAAALRMPL